MGGGFGDDGKVQLPGHLLDVVDERWLEESLPVDDVDLPTSMRLSSAAMDAMDHATASSAIGVASTSALMSNGTGRGEGGEGGHAGLGGADDGDGDDANREEERWGRGGNVPF